MSRVDRPRVLLLWPGGLFSGGGNFGVPQLLSIAGAIKKASSATVEVVDLDLERAFGRVDLAALLAPGYDLVGIACYSSYDYLKVLAIGARVRELLPRAWLATGGYHPSARPDDFALEGSPFDFVIVGDGEAPMAKLAAALETGKKPSVAVLGPEPVASVAEADPHDWSLLDRYLPVARSVASQAEIYLSRGCPYDCAFCMERAKRDTSWRAMDPLRAVEELHRLDRALDLSRWTLFVADALFGMKKPWRREFLEALARRPIRARKTWLLIRLDLLEREDLQLMAKANVAPGFGLESGDTEQLKRIRKTGKLEGYLEHMLQVADWCHEADVPFGANIIIGHPGETEATLRNTARYMEKLFLGDQRGSMGFLSVDPFRLYPGSPIDEDRAGWEARTGMRIHRDRWWDDGDQDFLSEWVDPSASLDWRTTRVLQQELFAPILAQLPKRFAYQGPARDYFERALDEQVELNSPRRLLHTLGRWHLWRGLTGETGYAQHAAVAGDAWLESIARTVRAETLQKLEATPPLREALLETPRERFVRAEDLPQSADDEPLLLDDEGRATVSALHAYVATFEALELTAGDALVDLGGGTGYGAALAARVVGPTGSVLTIEFDAALAAEAAQHLAEYPNVTAVAGDAHDVAKWKGATRVSVGFDVGKIPQAWLDALADDARMVVPVDGTLVRVDKRAGEVTTRTLGAVRYVGDRRAA
jgi:protein-L-isoaspartate(D-aspartate) O-methyltransferase